MQWRFPTTGWKRRLTVKIQPSLAASSLLHGNKGNVHHHRQNTQRIQTAILSPAFSKMSIKAKPMYLSAEHSGKLRNVEDNSQAKRFHVLFLLTGAVH